MSTKYALLCFQSSWAPQFPESVMTKLDTLSRNAGMQLQLINEADKSDLATQLHVTVVPTFIVASRPSRQSTPSATEEARPEEWQVACKIENGNLTELANFIEKLRAAEPRISGSSRHSENAQPKEQTSSQSESDDSIQRRLKSLINQSRVSIFIKGSPLAPRCGFTSQLISILDAKKVKYSYFDILTDDMVRQSLKEYSKWPTYPQVYVEGELVGGLDIIKEMADDEFKQIFLSE